MRVMHCVIFFGILGSVLMLGCSPGRPPAKPEKSITARKVPLREEGPEAVDEDDWIEVENPRVTSSIIFQTHSMHEIVQTGDVEAAQDFIEQGGSVTIKSVDGNTFLHGAVHKGHLEMVRLLVENGVDINAVKSQNSVIWTPLRIAVRYGHRDIVRFLIEKGAEVNFRYPGGRNFLHQAAFSGDAEMANILIEGGVEVNVVDDDGLTSLYIGVHKGHLELVRTLVDTGKIDTGIENNSPAVLVEMAGHSQDKEMIGFLEEWRSSIGQ